jgi:hypothetical protein
MLSDPKYLKVTRDLQELPRGFSFLIVERTWHHLLTAYFPLISFDVLSLCLALQQPSCSHEATDTRTDSQHVKGEHWKDAESLDS